MPALPVDAELLNRKNAKKKAAVEPPAKKAKPAASTEQAPPKPFGKRVEEQKAAVKPAAKSKATEKFESPAKLGITAGPSQDDRSPDLSHLKTRAIKYEYVKGKGSGSDTGEALFLTLGVGSKQGVYPGASGTITQGNVACVFTVVRVTDRTCFVEVLRDNGSTNVKWEWIQNADPVFDAN